MRNLGIMMIALMVTWGAATVVKAEGYGAAGCGLGSLVFKENDKTQILAATTNGTFGTQTFGITSGTSNCASGGVMKSQREQAAFAEVNFSDLKRNMAGGGGEFLMSFATLLGCEDAAKPALAKMTQANYETIVKTDNSSPLEMLSALKTAIKGNAYLAGSCSDERAVARAEGKLGPKPAVTVQPVAVRTVAVAVKTSAAK